MVDFPEAEAVEAELARAMPLAVLFGHGCSPRAHKLHEQLITSFAAAGLKLQRDPFETGDNVLIAMRRLQIHGLVFHATAKSLSSDACATELKTAEVLAAPIICLRDQVAIPEALRDRIFLDLPESGELEPRDAEKPASAMRPRARLHWVWQWLRESSRSVWEREGGVNWLLTQEPQVLAEFFEPLTHLHQLEKEDPTVSSLLAALLERTGLRHEAQEHLRRWWHAVEHPLSRDTIRDILISWGFPVPTLDSGVTQGRTRTQSVAILAVCALSVAGVLVVRGCHFMYQPGPDGPKIAVHIGVTPDEFREAWESRKPGDLPSRRPEDF